MRWVGRIDYFNCLLNDNSSCLLQKKFTFLMFHTPIAITLTVAKQFKLTQQAHNTMPSSKKTAPLACFLWIPPRVCELIDSHVNWHLFLILQVILYTVFIKVFLHCQTDHPFHNCLWLSCCSFSSKENHNQSSGILKCLQNQNSDFFMHLGNIFKTYMSNQYAGCFHDGKMSHTCGCSACVGGVWDTAKWRLSMG